MCLFLKVNQHSVNETLSTHANFKESMQAPQHTHKRFFLDKFKSGKESLFYQCKLKFNIFTCHAMGVPYKIGAHQAFETITY